MAKIIQFGTGRFLRGFFDPIVDEPCSVTVVQSRANSTGAAQINRSRGEFHVWTRGILDHDTVDEVETVRSIDRALDANSQWQEVLEVGRSADLRLVVSNTTEAGLALVDEQQYSTETSACPNSFPAKLLDLLYHRYRTGLGGLTILPLELVEQNGNVLCELAFRQAHIWELSQDSRFMEWLEAENSWLNSLVDRIVVGVTDSPPWSWDDELAVVAEPFKLLAIENDDRAKDAVPNHPMVEWVSDLKPYHVRKVRILNGLHTAMVAHSFPKGFSTVLDVMNDPTERSWLESLFHEEILPALNAQDIDAEAFAMSVLERFENPFFQHKLADIANGHSQKLLTRIQPTIADYRKFLGSEPRKLLSVMKSADLS